MKTTFKNEDDPENKDSLKNEDNLRRMMITLKMKTCSIEGCIIDYLNRMLTTPHLDSHSTTDPKPEILSAV